MAFEGRGLAARITLIGMLALGACASKTVCTPTGAPLPPPDWRDFVSDADHDKLRELRTAFLDGLDQARQAGFTRQIDAEGRLFNPDFAQDGATLRPGAYHCRTFSLGAAFAGHPKFVADPPRTCTVAQDGQVERLAEQDGPQRLQGRLFPDEPARGIFLGTRILPDEATALQYGRDTDRDLAGAVQRVGDARWRIAIPRPAWGAVFEMIELTPAS